MTRFEVGQIVYYVNTCFNGVGNVHRYICTTVILKPNCAIDFMYHLTDDGYILDEDLFETYEEAEEKLKEIDNG